MNKTGAFSAKRSKVQVRHLLLVASTYYRAARAIGAMENELASLEEATATRQALYR